MSLASYTKQPIERKDYDILYEDWLRPDPYDSLDLVEHRVIVLSAGEDTTPLVVERIDITATVMKLWVSGGTSGVRYKVELDVTTQRGRVDQIELVFKVKDT